MANRDNYWTRQLESGRITRRRFVGGAALAGVGAASLGLVGCGDDDSTAPSTATTAPGASATVAKTETPKKGGSYTTAFVGPFAGADPHNSVYGGAGVVPVVYNYLLRNYEAYAPDKGNTYDLAESHKLQDDKVTVVFKIRDGVKISPNSVGVPERALDSDDVLKSWQRIGDAKSGSNGYGFASKWVDKMDAPDASTFRMVLKSPYAWTDAQVGNNLQGAIVPKERLAAADLKAKPVGAGPFMVDNLTEGAQAAMVRNPNYYKTGQPYLDKYTIRAFADQATWLTAFSSGQVDFYSALNQDEAKQIESNQKGVRHEKRPSVGFNSFWMNTKQAPWTDPRVRQAVNLATNRDEYIQIDGHGAGEPAGPVQYCYTGYALTKEELSKVQAFNVAEAKKLFDAAGVKEFSFSHPTGGSAANYVPIFVRHMQAAGVTAKPLPLDPGTWVAGYYTSKLGASLSLNQAYNTPDNAMSWYTTEGITGNHNYDTGFSDPAVDAAILKAAGTLDVNARKAAYQEAQRLVLSKSPAFFNFYGPQTDELISPDMRNFELKVSTLITAFAADWWSAKV
jgi:peptide/nickel transport system substrate-binding protein